MNSATKRPLNRKGAGFNEQRSLPESRMPQPMCEVGIARLICHFVVCRSFHFGQREVSIPLSRHYPLGKPVAFLLSKQSVRTIPVPVLIETNKKNIPNLFGGFVMGKGLLQIFFGELRVRLCHDDSLECLVVTMPPKIHIGRSRGVRRAWLFLTNCFQNRTRAIDPISRHPAEWHR